MDSITDCAGTCSFLQSRDGATDEIPRLGEKTNSMSPSTCFPKQAT